jgi:glycerol-3-phosphate acyltransferase PlsY
MNEALAIAIGYLLGSIPSAYVIAHLKTGKDIRRLGSGNVGSLTTGGGETARKKVSYSWSSLP